MKIRVERPVPRDREVYRARPIHLREDGEQFGPFGRFGWYVRWSFGLATTAGDGGEGYGRNRARGRGEGEGK